MSIVLTILGCGSSGGVPRIGNDWGDCDPLEPKNRRSRCALLVEKYGENGCTTVLIDTGPDIRQQLLSAEIRHIDAVLYTHSHADHLHGIDDLRAFMVRTGRKMPVFMDAATSKRAIEAFEYCFRTPEGSNYPPILERHLIKPDAPVEISGAGGTLVFDPIEVAHGEINALGFKIEGAAYVPDVSDIPEKGFKALKNISILILDCLRRRPHPSHFCLEDSLDWTRRLSPGKTIFTNLHNDLDYRTLCEELPETIVPAFDGMRVELTEKDQVTALSAHAG